MILAGRRNRHHLPILVDKRVRRTHEHAAREVGPPIMGHADLLPLKQRLQPRPKSFSNLYHRIQHAFAIEQLGLGLEKYQDLPEPWVFLYLAQRARPPKVGEVIFNFS